MSQSVQERSKGSAKGSPNGTAKGSPKGTAGAKKGTPAAGVGRGPGSIRTTRGSTRSRSRRWGMTFSGTDMSMR